MKKFGKAIVWVGYVGSLGWFGFGLVGWQFVMGNLIAGLLLLVDKLVYAWWLYPFEQSSIQIQYWMRRKDVKAVMGLLTSKSTNQQKLLFKSVGFGLMWILLATYMASSTGSVVAMGIVMGLGFDLTWNIVKDWGDTAKLGQWFCWQIKRTLSAKEIHWCGGIFVGMWFIFVLRLLLG